jgi:hypothetical protein
MPDRNAEITLARSAAPEAISSDAKILVLGWRGYETANEGKNGYMMSRAGYLNDVLGHRVPHLMFYFPLTDKSSWGADLRDSPVTLNPQFRDGPERITEFVIPVGKWSDGTAAPVM